MISLALGLGLMAAGLGSTPAQAVVTSGQLAIMSAGSDTTEFFMEQYMANRDGSNVGGTTVQTYNIPAKGDPELVDGDAQCDPGTPTDYTWVQTSPGTGQKQQPNGSSAGRNALQAQSAANTCIDIGRSSSGPGTSGNTNLNYYAFAYDAVGWATMSLAAPAVLTRAQIQSIYNCAITNWKDVGGADSPIQRYTAQDGSGTRSFFDSAFGITSAMYTNTTSSCPAVIKIQENDATLVSAAHRDTAIFPFSAGKWTYHYVNRFNPTLNFSNGSRMGAIEGKNNVSGATVKKPAVRWSPDDDVYVLDTSASGVVADANVIVANTTFNSDTDYPGIRYLYNIARTDGASYATVQQLVGFDNIAGGAKSPLCNGGAATLITSHGFAPMNAAGNPRGSNAAGSTCRVFAGDQGPS